MNTLENPLPTVPPLPTQPEPTWDQIMRHHEALMSQQRHEQGERAMLQAERAYALSVQAAERHERSIAATGRLADVQTRAADLVLRTLTDGIPTDQPMVDAIEGLRAAIAGFALPGGPVGASDPLVTLVSTMTSAERRNPSSAAAAARAQLAAITPQG